MATNQLTLPDPERESIRRFYHRPGTSFALAGVLDMGSPHLEAQLQRMLSESIEDAQFEDDPVPSQRIMRAANAIIECMARQCYAAWTDSTRVTWMTPFPIPVVGVTPTGGVEFVVANYRSRGRMAMFLEEDRVQGVFVGESGRSFSFDPSDALGPSYFLALSP